MLTERGAAGVSGATGAGVSGARAGSGAVGWWVPPQAAHPCSVPHTRWVWGALCSLLTGGKEGAVWNSKSLLPGSSIFRQYPARGLPSSSFGHIWPSQGHVYLATIRSEEISHFGKDWCFFHLHFKIRVLPWTPSARKPSQGCPSLQARPSWRHGWDKEPKCTLHSLVHTWNLDTGEQKTPVPPMADLLRGQALNRVLWAAHHSDMH